MSRWLAASSGILIAVGAISAVILVVLIGLALLGHAPTTVLTTWFHGAAGSWTRLALSVQEAGPLLLTGLAAAVAFRCGVWNIGAEGQFLIGAVTMVAFGTVLLIPGPGWLILSIVLILSAFSGAAWALLATGLERWRGVPVVLSTILLNFIAVAVVGMLVQGPLHDPTTTAPQTALMAEQMRLPVLVEGTRLHLGVLLAAIIAVALWLVLKRTTIGFEVQVVGLNPDAARLMGMPVGARQVLVMAVSGGLAGFAGAAHVAGVTGMLSGSPVSYGYAGIAVAMLGRLHPLGILVAALFLGMLSTGASGLERRLGIPHDLGDVVQGLLVLAVLVGGGITARRALRPQAEST
ncbi:MAG: ABC transporter permease [Planctomycetes bacterium]|nr:ABC transporter permease [Planctomycetota bacterium]